VTTLRVGAFAAEVVFDAFDVVFAEVVTVLELDHNDRLVGGVHHAVGSTTGNINGLADILDGLFAFENNGELASCDDPNFTSLLVTLVAEALAGEDGNGLYLVVNVVNEDVVTTPRAIVVFKGHAATIRTVANP
jgi:hypothetical protein